MKRICLLSRKKSLIDYPHSFSITLAITFAKRNKRRIRGMRADYTTIRLSELQQLLLLRL
jgi:hypothetical protein